MFCDAYILMAAIILWIPSKKFVQSLETLLESSQHDDLELYRNEEWNNIEREFATLKKLSELINKTFGDMVMHFLLECLLGYSYLMDAVSREVHQDNPDLKLFIFNVLYIFQCNCTFIFSGNLNIDIFKSNLIWQA